LIFSATSAADAFSFHFATPSLITFLADIDEASFSRRQLPPVSYAADITPADYNAARR
jgi:hypothetical protein